MAREQCSPTKGLGLTRSCLLLRYATFSISSPAHSLTWAFMFLDMGVRTLTAAEWATVTFHVATCFPKKKKILAHSRLKSGSDLNLLCDFIHNNRYHTTAFGNMFWLWHAQSFLQRHRRDDLKRQQERRNVACEPCRHHLTTKCLDRHLRNLSNLVEII